MKKNIFKKKIIVSWFKKKRIKIDDEINLLKCDQLDSFVFIEFLIFLQTKFKIRLNHEKIFHKKNLNLNDILKILDQHENRKIKKK